MVGTTDSMLRLLLPTLLHAIASRCAGAVYSDPSLLDSTVSHGMIIDAGSSGSRMHVYEWEPRMFETLPPPISIPGSTNQWTHRMNPGISSYSTHPEDIHEALTPLVDFAKDILKDHEEDWKRFPIYLKATAGMRQLSYTDREAVLAAVRDFLGNPETCPFYFQFDHARVISGEEEGIYGWAAVNFLRGELLALSQGAGTAESRGNMTVGTLDLGGASTQISFFKSDQDILANLFKLQIGGQKHWNVYTHSFLQFGLNSARIRMHTKVADTAEAAEGGDPFIVVDACLPEGFDETFVSPEDGQEYLIVPAEGGADFDECDKQTAFLLEAHSANDNFCEFAFPGQCSVLGVYQPELPKGDEYGRFYGFAGYYKLWQFLNLEEATTITDITEEGRRVCGMSHEELTSYNFGRHKYEKNVEYLPKYCFMSSYITTLLRDGFGFPEEETIHFVDEVGGYKVDWALGSMLYEINALPWSYVTPSDPSAETSAEAEATAAAAAAAATAAGSAPGSPTGGRRRTTVAWTSIAAAAAAIAALVYGYLERNRRFRDADGGGGRGGGSGVSPSSALYGGGGEQASPWRMPGAGGAGGVIGAGAEGGGRTSNSQYESISDVTSAPGRW